MDSPVASPRIDRTQYSFDDDSDASSLLPQWTRSIKPLYKAASVFILGMAFCALVFSFLPLWRLMGVILLHKLWDILRFLLITSSIGLGIINSKLWRGSTTERDMVASGGGNEESISSKVPFAGVFYGNFQTTYSFSSEDEHEMGENGIVSRSVSENGRDCEAKVAAATTVDDEEELLKSPPDAREVQVSEANTDVSRIKVGKRHEGYAKMDEDDGPGVVEKPPRTLSVATDWTSDIPAINLKRRSHRLLDDMDLATVVEDEQPEHRTSKIAHRRGNSLDLPIEQEGALPRHGDIYAAPEDHRRRKAADHHQKGVDTSGERASSSKKATSSTVKGSDHLKAEPNDLSARKPNMMAVATQSTTTSTTRHSRSRSAYDLKELLVGEPVAQSRKPRSKPADTASSQLGKRRNVSLSCDLDKEYAVGGVPAWLAALPSPPAPPLIDGYGMDGEGGVLFGQTQGGKQADEGSLRKAYSESLAPWRAVANAVPVDIASKGSMRKPVTKQDRKKLSPAKVATPPSSTSSTPTSSFMGSPGPGELNKKVDAFIARFHERMRLQRLESLERSRQKQITLFGLSLH